MTKQKEIYSTRDLYLASTLLSLKFILVGIDYQYEGMRNMPVGYFQFEQTPDLLKAEKNYFQGLLAIEPTTFISNMRKLKAQVSNFQKNPSNIQ